MRASLFGWSSLVTVLAACSSADHGAAQRVVTPIDSGSLEDASRTTAPDSSSPRADASSSPDGTGTIDSAAACEAKVGPAPDFSVTVSNDVSYDGPVAVEAADAGALQLVVQGDGGGVRALLDGVAPALAGGTTLWASLHRSTFHANPYNTTTLVESRVSVSEHGPVLAQMLHTYLPGNPATREFLGVIASVARVCSHIDTTHPVSGESCLVTDFYVVTIHGDADLTLTPASEGHVMIHGIEYEVWLAQAQVQTETPSANGPCVSDWAPPAGFSLAGRAARYEDVLRAAARDAGIDSGR